MNKFIAILLVASTFIATLPAHAGGYAFRGNTAAAVTTDVVTVGRWERRVERRRHMRERRWHRRQSYTRRHYHRQRNNGNDELGVAILGLTLGVIAGAAIANSGRQQESKIWCRGENYRGDPIYRCPEGYYRIIQH